MVTARPTSIRDRGRASAAHNRRDQYGTHKQMNTLKQVLQAAIEFESQGGAFYLEAATRVTDPTSRSILDALAKDEYIHARVIGQYHQAIEGQMRAEIVGD